MASAGEIVRTRAPMRRRQPSPRSLEIFRRAFVFGETHRAIAERYGISRRRVGYICASVEKWISSQPVGPDIPAIRQQHQQTLRWLMGEALREWERSKQTVRTTKAKKVSGRVNGKGQTMPDLTTTEYVEHQQCGDPRYITVMKELMQSERTMLGADEPKQTQITGPNGGPITLASVLSIIEANPPSPPEFRDPNPPNVIDVDSFERLIDDPNFLPETLGGSRQTVSRDHSSETGERFDSGTSGVDEPGDEPADEPGDDETDGDWPGDEPADIEADDSGADGEEFDDS